MVYLCKKRTKKQMDEIYLTCRVCSVVFKDQRSLIRHLKGNCGRDFGTYENYIINFYYNGAKPVCKCGCGVELTFESHRVPKFYNDYTRNHFPRKPHTDASKEKIANGYKRTMQANYGIDNAMEIPEFKRKIKETKLKRYNDENYNNTPKARETSLQRFGVSVAIQLPEVKEKAAQTNIQRYGAIAITCTDAGKAKVKSTKEKRYGNPYYCNIEKSRETKLERYGYECEFKDLEKKFQGEKGVDLRYIQDLLGHESSKTTEIYTHTCPDFWRDHQKSLGQVAQPD